jgi:hypothetical protein
MNGAASRQESAPFAAAGKSEMENVSHLRRSGRRQDGCPFFERYGAGLTSVALPGESSVHHMLPEATVGAGTRLAKLKVWIREASPSCLKMQIVYQLKSISYHFRPCRAETG